MHIEIQTNGFELTAGLREHTERRLRFALSWASHDVRKVAVRLFDINGPRGGNDKRCRIQIPLPGTADVMIEDTEPDLYIAIDRAADRADRAVARLLERQRQHRHGTAKNAAPEESSDLADSGALTAASNHN